jgi:antitoxin VapB
VAFHIRDRETDLLVRQLARKHGVGLTEAVRIAVREKLQSEARAVPVSERIAGLRAEVLKRPETGLKADKDFFDELSGDL